MKKRNILVAMMTALALCVTAVPASVYAQDATAETTVTQETENTEASNVNGADDPGAGRLAGHIAPEFFGEQSMARTTANYEHADKQISSRAVIQSRPESMYPNGMERLTGAERKKPELSLRWCVWLTADMALPDPWE